MDPIFLKKRIQYCGYYSAFHPCNYIETEFNIIKYWKLIPIHNCVKGKSTIPTFQPPIIYIIRYLQYIHGEVNMGLHFTGWGRGWGGYQSYCCSQIHQQVGDLDIDSKKLLYLLYSLSWTRLRRMLHFFLRVFGQGVRTHQAIGHPGSTQVVHRMKFCCFGKTTFFYHGASICIIWKILTD